METQRVAVVTGANRGLGLGTAAALAERGYTVALTARDMDAAREAAKPLQARGLQVVPMRLDVTRQSEVAALARELDDRFGRVDVLVNNAAVVSPDGDDAGKLGVFEADPLLIARIFDANTLGPMRLCQALVPLMRRNGYGRIVNVSSGMGALHDMGGGWPGYRLSKAALNALTRILTQELGEAPIKVNAVCPGWVQTDMGGPDAPRTLDQGVQSVLWAALLPDDGPRGGFFRDGVALAW
jgi:NAD(P)-dependent dehydrogenase (short-subunit alcohol dehydrogenase family)